MNGQTTRKLVKIALLFSYQTNLRTQISNDHQITYLMIYLTTDTRWLNILIICSPNRFSFEMSIEMTLVLKV